MIDDTDTSRNLCNGCGYDLRAHQSNDTRCPECGKPVSTGDMQRLRNPGIIWHVLQLCFFAIPLTALWVEAVSQRKSHSFGAAHWAPNWLHYVMALGAAGLIACVVRSTLTTAHRKSQRAYSVAILILYLVVISFMSTLIEWSPYKV